eukprot:TRINITY_DN10005_c0_g1_i2.p1 TRINITY_DN10005_c0_g1~~TRINITY_DN10005_c0_g1_i2.p1  ORF type:complete len:377 (+),score=56.99 TRINITY_DN10005_c0_g1_i2:963-2093(+)
MWVDPILEKRPEYTKDKKGVIHLEDGGRKKIQPVNIKCIFENASSCEVDYHQFLYNSKTCVVTEVIHFKATLQELLELERFPFDRQYLTMRLCIRTKDFNCLSSPPSFVPDRLGMRKMASYTCAPSISGWRAHSPVAGTSIASGQTDDLRVTISLRVERQYGFFMSNIVLIIFLIVLLAPIAFAIDHKEVSDRMQIILTLLLTVVTFKWIIAGEVPKTSTVTLLDKYILLSLLMFFLVVIQTTFANIVDFNRLVNLPSLFGQFLLAIPTHLATPFLSPSPSSTLPSAVLPTLPVLLIVFSMCGNCNFDIACAIVMLSFWVLFHFLLMLMAKSGLFYRPWNRMKDEGAGGPESFVTDPVNIKLETTISEPFKRKTSK